MKMKKEKYIAPTTMIVVVEAGSIMAGSITGEENKGFTGSTMMTKMVTVSETSSECFSY